MTQEQGLARREAGGNIVQRTEGMQVHKDSLMPPIVVLVQAQSGEGTPGMLRRQDTGEERPTIDVVPLASRVTQVKWPAGGFTRDSTPVCWSNDGFRAAQGALYEGTMCAACEFYNPRPAKGESGGEMCQTGHNVVFMEAESFDTFAMRLHGTANRIVNLISAKSVAGKAIVSLYSEKAPTDNRGSWYQLKAKTVRVAEEDVQSLAAALIQDYASVDVGVRDAPIEEEQAEQAPAASVATPSGGAVPAQPNPAAVTSLCVCVTVAPQVGRATREGRGTRVRLFGQPEGKDKVPIAVVAYGDLAERLLFLNPKVGDVLECAGAMEESVITGAKVTEFVLSKAAKIAGQLGARTTVAQDKDSMYGPEASKERLTTQRLESPDPDDLPF